METPTPAQEVHHFWFKTLAPKDWFKKSKALDHRIATEFGALVPHARAGKLDYWRVTPVGRLAEILVLDQFSRNIYRDSAEAFAGDGLALQLAKDAIEAGAPEALSIQQRAFLYIPFMHSENLAEHDRALTLFSEPGLENQLKYEHSHRRILERFGRYPHCNETLGRKSTPEEIEFLGQPGSSF